MPYELDYKKVHNTLMGKRHDNIFGNLLGQKVTSPKKVGNDYIVDLNKYGETQLVIFNEAVTGSNNIIFQVLENSSAISYDCVKFKEVTGYTKINTSSTNIKYELSPKNYLLVILPANKTFLFDDPISSSFRWITPDQIKISGSNFSIYYTKNNVVDVVEDGIVINYVNTINNGGSEVVPVEEFNDIWSWDEDSETDMYDRAIDAINQLECSYIPIQHKITIQTNAANKGYLERARDNLNLDLVLIPCRYYSEQNNRRGKRGTWSEIKNINNARNERQQTYTRVTTKPFVTNHYDASVYIEPITIDFGNSTEWELSLEPLPRHGTWQSLSVGTDLSLLEAASRRGNNLYALHNPEKILILCTACGYDHGIVGGITCIGFAVGLQKRLPQDSPIIARSGCGISYARRTNITFDLPRHALASTNENDYPVIKIDIN